MNDPDLDPKLVSEGMDAGQLIAHRVNALFARRRAPNGRPYSLSAVSLATNNQLSAPYLHALRNGHIDKPGIDKMRLLADFFGVDLDYFSPSTVEPSATDVPVEEEEAIRRAMADPLLREISLGVSELDDEEKMALLTLVAKARARATRQEERRTEAE